MTTDPLAPRSTPAAALAATELVEAFVAHDDNIGRRLHEADREVVLALTFMVAHTVAALSDLADDDLTFAMVLDSTHEMAAEAFRTDRRSA